MNKEIYPCLWFNGNAKEVANYYCNAFENTKITSESPLVIIIESSGQRFMLLNGGPEFRINMTISFFVTFEKLEKLNETWEKLKEGGSILMSIDKYEWSERYGWLQDKFGINWQLSLGKIDSMGQKFVPSLMFTGKQNGNAEKAINFYTSVFKNSSIKSILKFNADENETAGHVKHAQFQLGNNVFMAMDNSTNNGIAFNEALSLVVECDDQDEIDYFWKKFTENGEESMCGWLKDQFGVSWQIVPSILPQLMNNPESAQNVMNAFLQMKKFEIAKLIEASKLNQLT